MAELAAGAAVRSLLGVIRSEAQLLGRVGSDVQFIKEEMESMNSFLEHLARTGAEKDEQVRAWMSQVRVLAHDCSNCLDLYLYRGDHRDIHRAKGSFWSCLWWAPWFVQRMVAQHQAATQLRELKHRARDVGERRLRYGVEVPAKAKAAAGHPGHPSSHPAAGGNADDAAGDDDDDEDESEEVDPAARWRAGLLVEPPALEDYFQEKLRQWTSGIWRRPSSSTKMPSIAVVAPDTAIAQEALAVATHYLGSKSNRTIVIDTKEASQFYGPLNGWEILCYILWSLKPHLDKKGEDIEERAWTERCDIVNGIRRKIREMDLGSMIEKISGKISGIMTELKQEAVHILIIEQLEPLGVLQYALQQLIIKPPDIQQHMAATEADRGELSIKPPDIQQHMADTEADRGEHNMLSEGAKEALTSYNIKQTANKLKELMEMDNKTEGWISLGSPLYETILKEVFPAPKQKHSQRKRQDGQILKIITTDINNTATTSSNASAGESQIKEIVHKYTREIIHDFLEDTVKKLAADKPTQDQTSDDATEDIQEKIQRIRWMIEDQMLTKGIVDRIDKELRGRIPMIIIVDDNNRLPDWNKISNDLSMLSCLVKGAVVVTTTKKTQQAKEYCSEPWDPISYSLAGLYHDWVLYRTNQPVNEDIAKRSEVLRSILEKCEPHEFCMKIFAHALYANPKSSIDELQKLDNILVPEKILGANAKKMFKFSYSTLPKEYQSCLLYLAIFPKGNTVRRSTLVGRWVAEGLIAEEEWPISVRRAERCFDLLVDRWLVHPVHFTAAGKVKSCMVGDPVHAFITKIAKKQHIVETRLSHHLARHFSIFNDLRLRGSDTINEFLVNLCGSSHFLHLKVLDLEGCRCFSENLHYLREICRKIALLKYLGLRNTDITNLPREINRLHKLEVLDIRETRVHWRATKRVMLLKLRRLLYSAGSTHDDTKSRTSVRIPDKIGKMVHMETLSNVHASESGEELKDIGQLSQLRKLGVVIEDTDAHLINLLQAISDLHECLQSLSITLTKASTGSSNSELPPKNAVMLQDNPKALESLTINGKGQILDLLLSGGDYNWLTKVTLRNTLLNHEALKVLAQLPMLLCVRLRDKAYISSILTLKKNGFKRLNSFIVEGSNMDVIKFEAEAVPELKKMVLSSYYIMGLSGVENLPELEELELSNSNKLLIAFAKAKRIDKVTLRDHILEESQLEVLTKKAKIHCLVLLFSSCNKTELTFGKDSFPDLNFVTVDCPGITSICFSKGSAPKLKKIIWSITHMRSFFSGIENLSKLKEIEINGEVVPHEVEEAIITHKNLIIFRHNKPEEKEATYMTYSHAGRVPRFWKHWR